MAFRKLLRRARMLLTNNRTFQDLRKIFDLPLLTTLVPIWSGGSGTATFTRATTAYQTDFEGKLNAVLSGEARFQGARRVENLIPAAGTGSASLANGANKTMTVAVGTYVFSIGAEATGTNLITFTGTATGSSGTLTANATKRASTVLTITAAGTIIATSTTLAAVDLQLENVTGQTNQNPSEYVSVGVLSAPYHGAGVDGVKYFSTENGNTVASNVVTEATGAAIAAATLKGYNAEGARTNLCLQSNSFATTWADSSATPTQNLTGPDGATSGWTLTDASNVAAANIVQTVAVSNATQYTFSAFVKKTSGATTFPGLFVYVGTEIAAATIDTNNGLATAWTAYTGLTVLTSSATCVSHNADWWRVSLIFTTQAVSYGFYLEPAITTNATQSTGTTDVTVQGTAGFACAQLEAGSFASSYIPTTTVAVARNADILSYANSGNISSTSGTAYAEALINGTAGQNQPLISLNNTGGTERYALYADLVVENKLGMYDGTNLTFGGAVTLGAQIKAASSWNAAATAITINGAAATSGSFDGDLDSNILQIGIQPGVAGRSLFGTIRNVRIYGRALSAAQLQQMTS